MLCLILNKNDSSFICSSTETHAADFFRRVLMFSVFMMKVFEIFKEFYLFGRIS